MFKLFSFFKSFQFYCYLFGLIKKKMQLAVQVYCLIYFLLYSRFFKEKQRVCEFY